MKRLTAILSAFDREDIPILILFAGIVLVGFGLSRFHPGLGLAVSGMLIVIYVRPIIRWFK